MKMSNIANRSTMIRTSWLELANLNNNSKDNLFKVRECLKVFDVG
ncbi:MAG: hypothetical protein OXH90_03800 [Paracoccaceae bacterium]|nr:hypothetical protein [Paracoccaceae bacterium]MDE2916955.1 hypothetical protein [Paracoccaceae bacterium]